MPWSAPILRIVQRLKGAAAGQELVPTALFHHPALVHDHDQVCVANGRKTMGYDDERSPSRALLDGPRHALLYNAVER